MARKRKVFYKYSNLEGRKGTKKEKGNKSKKKKNKKKKKEKSSVLLSMGFPGGADDRESACSAGDLGSIPGLGRSPGGGHDNPLQYSGLESLHGQRSLVGYQSMGSQSSDMTELSIIIANMITHRKMPINFIKKPGGTLVCVPG